MTGRIHSFQSLGTLDGPGVRFVVFMQGCPLRCGCCHNPDTWDVSNGTEYAADDVVRRAARYREYFGADGGVTVSGGEPLLQAAFVREFFALCRDARLDTCLDTSGCMLNPDVSALLDVTDRVLLDIKYTTDALYRAHVGCGMDGVLEFLAELDRRGIPTTLRQVIIPSINDTEENIRALKAIADAHGCVEKIELLPFRKICQVKYDQLDIRFPFGDIPEPSRDVMRELEAILQ